MLIKVGSQHITWSTVERVLFRLTEDLAIRDVSGMGSS